MTEQLVREWLDLRRSAGLSQSDVAAVAGISPAEYGRLERGETSDIGLRRAALVSSTLGSELTVKLYPVGPPIRDAAHVELLRRFDARISGAWRVKHESPVGSDARAWDRRLDGPAAIGVEAETVIGDIQALERRMQLKKRDGGVQRMILLVRGTRTNRRLLADLLPVLRATFPLGTGDVLRSLREGRDPGADGIVVL